MEALVIDSGFVAKCIPARRSDSHKGMNGSACVVGGSRLYHGAPFLTASAAMRAGLDLVYLAVPASISAPVRALSPDLIVLPLPDSRLTRGNVSKLRAWLPKVDAAAIGPGLGPQNPKDVAYCVNQLRGDVKGLVLDADALRPGAITAKVDRLVVTPHAGEFERFFETRLPGKLDERVELAKEKAASHELTILLKGPTDIITDGKQVGLNETHSPAMTVGGTGDVLTGVTAALMAKGVPPFDAACSAAYITGAAGLEAAREVGLHLTPSDVVARIATVMKKFDKVI